MAKLFKNYGIPYKGSKNRNAEKLLAVMPSAHTFVDLFAGGCAMTHAAMLSGQYERFIINDIDPMPTQCFLDAIEGKFRNEKRWISREDFGRLKNSDPYARYCFSFQNNGDTYLYPPETERFKKWLHLMFFADTPTQARLYWINFVDEFRKVKQEIAEMTPQVEALCQECGVECLRKADGTVDAAKIKSDVFTVLSADIRAYINDALGKSGYKRSDVDKWLGTATMASRHYFGESQWALPTEENYTIMQRHMPALTIPWGQLNSRLEQIKTLETLETLETLRELQNITCLERLQSMELLNVAPYESHIGDYEDVEIPPNSVIYCDPPYKSSDLKSCYGNVSDFDFERFYRWCERQTQPLFISEYSMPEDRFTCVLSVDFFQSAGHKAVKERLYRPKRQVGDQLPLKEQSRAI